MSNKFEGLVERNQKFYERSHKTWRNITILAIGFPSELINFYDPKIRSSLNILTLDPTPTSEVVTFFDNEILTVSTVEVGKKASLYHRVRIVWS